jgi:hypothetical protein
MIAFKIIAIAALVLLVRFFLTRGRSLWRDRIVVVTLCAVLVIAIVLPDTTIWLANKFGIVRGVDLAFYAGFLLLFFLVGIQRIRLHDQSEALTSVVRELALLRARLTESEGSPPRP